MLVLGRWLRNSPCGLKHARHPLACGQGQTRPSLRACDANKAPSQTPPQPFSASLAACPGRWDAAYPLANTTRASSLRTPPAGHQGLSGPAAGRLVGAEQRSGEVGARSALRHLTGRVCLNAAAGGRGVSYAAPPQHEQRKAVPPGAGPTTKKPGRRPTQTPPRAAPKKCAATGKRTAPKHYVCTKITRISKKDQGNLPV